MTTRSPSRLSGAVARLAIGGILLAVFCRGLPGAPPPYQKRAGWDDIIAASLLALGPPGGDPAFDAFESGIVRGGEPAHPVRVNVAGAEVVYLFVTGCPDVTRGSATWADARLVAPDGSVTRLCEIDTLEVLHGRYSVDITLRSGLYEGLRIAGRSFAHGLHVQADSAIRVPLGGAYERFEAEIGIDDWVGDGGHVRFSVTGPRGLAFDELWRRGHDDFPDGEARRTMRWHREDAILTHARTDARHRPLATRYASACHRVPPLATIARRLAESVTDEEGLRHVREIYYRSRILDEARRTVLTFDAEALRLALEDIRATFGDRYPRGEEFLRRLAALEAEREGAARDVQGMSIDAFEDVERLAGSLEALRREALLANPLLEFGRLLVIRRTPKGGARRADWGERGYGEYTGLPRQSSWSLATVPDRGDWDNEIAVLAPLRPDGELTMLYRPASRGLVSDVDLHFDADRLLFSMPDERNMWQVWELDIGGGSPRRVTPGDQPDVHCFDSCYLPDGGIAFISTAVLQGVPCNPAVIVGTMYRMDADGGDIRQLGFEQDHDYCPTVLNDGRILYLRWDYTDTPHVWNRLLMSANPDGTAQTEYYGSNSYWPNAIFYARPIPGDTGRVVGIVTGHHEGRIGELVIFDPARGRQETAGVVQRIPGRGKRVEPRIEDKLTEHSWPKFVHPFPLSDTYFLVSCKPTPDSLWGIYLVDVFDNMVLVKEEEGYALLEPLPFRATPRPPVIPDRTRPESEDALAYMVDVYQGPGLEGVPRGAVKALRLFTYHFGYQTLAGIDHRVGADGPWEVKRVLGTVPVEEDGSAFFRIPARTPISVQPLDAEGKALALMRSWMTAMPGETLSCVGCHDGQNNAVVNQSTRASRRQPSDIQPWRGPVRGFSFAREVQPVLDRLCVGCHDGTPDREGRPRIDLRRREGEYICYRRGEPDGVLVRGVPRERLFAKYGGVFEPSYIELRRFVRVGGLESDLHVLPPMEFCANTSELVQMLRAGHHGVELDDEAWDRLVTWIDLNAPCHGTWREVTALPGNQRERRRLLRRLYGGVDEDAEVVAGLEPPPVAPIVPPSPPPAPAQTAAPGCPGWPFDAAEARRRQGALGPARRTIDLGEGVTLELVRIPAGSFAMGDSDGASGERPLRRVDIGSPFWISACEITNEQFARFDSSHDSRFEHRSSWIFSEEYLGWPLNGPRQPVVRVSWNRAMAFCRWLSDRAGERVTLPSEEQWEYACRAGTATPLFYGDLDADFSGFANMADASLRRLSTDGWRPRAPDLAPRDGRFDDGALVTTGVGSYRANAWGLLDVHGNAAEWTSSVNPSSPDEESRVVRGGSWRDRPARCRSAFRLSYPRYQPVSDVGFRVVVPAAPE